MAASISGSKKRNSLLRIYAESFIYGHLHLVQNAGHSMCFEFVKTPLSMELVTD